MVSSRVRVVFPRPKNGLVLALQKLGVTAQSYHILTKSAGPNPLDLGRHHQLQGFSQTAHHLRPRLGKTTGKPTGTRGN